MTEDPLGTGSGVGGAVPATGPLSPSPPSGRVPPPRKKQPWIQLSEAELESACKLAARGVEVETIADALLLPEKRVARALRSRKGRHKVRWLRGQAILQELEHEEAMRGLLPRARKSVKEGLECASAKDAAQIGMKVHEAVIQKPPQRIEHTHQGRIEHDLTPIFERLQESLGKIREAQQGRDPLARVVRGDVGLAQHRPLLPADTDGSGT